MNLQITFDPSTNDKFGSRLVISVGDALIRSYPMTAEDHYRDLFALKYFINRKTLSSIMLGDEPVGEVEFLNDGDFVMITPYERPKMKVFSGKFRLEQGLNHIDHILRELAAVISTDTTLLERRVVTDIDAGVYNTCLIDRHGS